MQTKNPVPVHKNKELLQMRIVAFASAALLALFSAEVEAVQLQAIEPDSSYDLPEALSLA